MKSAEKYVPNYTVDDYKHWEGDWELWQGVPVSTSPSAFGRHSSILMNIGAAFKTAITKSGCTATVLGDPENKSLIALKLESETYAQVDVGNELDFNICETCHLTIPASAIFE